ncbi:MAG: hypothetical protein D6795_14780 [Deltaproteobacteria bacterium]|nr:MAG: hypothetical protein D6795_14780 [Deltaproteobacteria bacterium]
MKRSVFGVLLVIGALAVVSVVSGPGCGDPCELIAVSTTPADQICLPSQRVDLSVEFTADPSTEISQVTAVVTQGRRNTIDVELVCGDTGCSATFCSVEGVEDPLTIEVTASTPATSCSESVTLPVSTDPNCVGVCNL